MRLQQNNFHNLLNFLNLSSVARTLIRHAACRSGGGFFWLTLLKRWHPFICRRSPTAFLFWAEKELDKQMRIEDFSFELRPLSDLPPDDGDLTDWLADLNCDDAVWVVSGDGQPEQAGAAGDDHIILWQDEPITDEHKRDAVEEYEDYKNKVAAEDVFRDYLYEFDWNYENMIAPLLRFVLDKQMTEDFQKYLADVEGLTTSWDRRRRALKHGCDDTATEIN